MSDIREIAEDLAAHAEAFCRTYFPNGLKNGNYWQMGDVSGNAGRSLKVRLHPSGGRPAGKWTDWATGEHGDLLDLLSICLGSDDYHELLEEARHFLGRPETKIVPVQPNPAKPQTSNKIEAGRKLFSRGRDFRKTLVEQYLRSRWISRFSDSLRYHPEVFYRDEQDVLCKGPAMLAAITDNDGQITGCARTWLDPNTKSKASMEEPKRVLGQLYGNAVRFKGDEDDGDLIAGEGLETVLSVGTAFPVKSLAACLTATHLGLFMPPSHIKRLWIARDKDEAGDLAAERLRATAEDMGIIVFDLHPVRNDFNDDLMEDGLMSLRANATAQVNEQMTRMGED